MALEQSIVMGIALAWLFVRMLSESEEEEQRAERYAQLGLEHRAVLDRGAARSDDGDVAAHDDVAPERHVAARPRAARASTQRRRAGREARVEVARRSL